MIAVYTKQPDKLILAKAELDANQVEAKMQRLEERGKKVRREQQNQRELRT